MKKISRNSFLKQSMSLGASMYYLPGLGFPQKTAFFSSKHLLVPFWAKMVAANDAHVQSLMEMGDSANRHGGRSFGYNFAFLAAAYACEDSEYFKASSVIKLLGYTADRLIASQRPDGTINAGNLESPPDTAFIMEPVCAGVLILSRMQHRELDQVKTKIKAFVTNAGKALVAGGVHTPNHRWVVCHALARINQLYPDINYVNRIDEWLSEGIFMDEDGHYPERSMNYSDVENNAFITMGRLLNRPELFEFPRKSLEMTYLYMEPNGDLVTFDSRRQDQYSNRSIVVQYLHYRFFAIHDQDGNFSAITSLIEGFPGFEQRIIREALFYFMENEYLQKELPKAKAVPTNYEKVFETSGLVRIRRSDTTLTIFGGVDWPLIIASGRSVSPNFFGYRKGNAVLKYMRMSPGFFSMGYFRSQGLSQEGNSYVLYQKLEVPYYQPLPEQHKNKTGDYALTPSVDGRFWSKMAFDKRPVSNVKTLESKITISEEEGKAYLLFEVNGLEGVAVTIELCFDEDGQLSGTKHADTEMENHFLAEGFGSFTQGGDSITFGPGIREHERINRLAGEQYSVHFGSLRTAGNHVYLTGFTPFRHKLTFG